MFYYYGGKKRLASAYDAPAFTTSVEPFAGAAGYSLYHLASLERVILIERDERVCEAWRTVLSLSPAELASYPIPAAGEKTQDFLVMTAAASNAVARLKSLTVTPRVAHEARRMFRLIAEQKARVGDALDRIDLRHGDYHDAPIIEATYFIDPPYEVQASETKTSYPQGLGYAAGCDASVLDFHELGKWAAALPGQVIVCEQAGATWLPFRAFRATGNTLGGRSREVVWTNGYGQAALAI